MDQARASFPEEPRVVDIVSKLIVDSTGDEAVDIQVKLDNDTPEEKWTLAVLAPFENAIRESLRAADIELWPYFHFFTPAEEAETEAEVRESERQYLERNRDQGERRR